MTWVDTRLGALATSRVSNVDKHSVEGERPVRLCNYTDVYYNDVIRDSLPFMQATASPTQVERFRLHPGDVVITKDSETADDIGIPAFVESAGEDLICGYHLAILRPTSAVLPRFLFWSLAASHVAAQWEVMATGVTRVGLKAGDLKTIRLRIPSTVNEQRAIADFLDRETAKIDALIEKQNELIGLLRERLFAVAHALVWPTSTTGADASESLGIPPTPSHWRVLRNKYVLRESAAVSSDGSEEPLSVSHLTGITPRSQKAITMIEAASYEGYRLVKPGDLVINTMWAWMGALGFSRYAGLVSPAYGVYAVRDDVQVDPRFLDAVLRSEPYVALMTVHSRGVWTSRLRLYPDVFLRLPVPMPPLEEQREIAGRLDREAAKIDALISKAEQFVELAQERRVALISAAVTGQIDVVREAG